MTKKQARTKRSHQITVVRNPPTPEEIRREKFQALAMAFGECLDQLVEDGIRHLTNIALAPVKNTLIDAGQKANARQARK